MISDNFLYFVVKNIKEIMYVVRPRAGTILRALWKAKISSINIVLRAVLESFFFLEGLA